MVGRAQIGLLTGRTARYSFADLNERAMVHVLRRPGSPRELHAMQMEHVDLVAVRLHVRPLETKLARSTRLDTRILVSFTAYREQVPRKGNAVYVHRVAGLP